MEARNAGSLRTLPSDQQDVLEAVAVELRHGGQVVRERLTLSSLQRFDELLDGLICEFLMFSEFIFFVLSVSGELVLSPRQENQVATKSWKGQAKREGICGRSGWQRA